MRSSGTSYEIRAVTMADLTRANKKSRKLRTGFEAVKDRTVTASTSLRSLWRKGAAGNRSRKPPSTYNLPWNRHALKRIGIAELIASASVTCMFGCVSTEKYSVRPSSTHMAAT